MRGKYLLLPQKIISFILSDMLIIVTEAGTETGTGTVGVTTSRGSLGITKTTIGIGTEGGRGITTTETGWRSEESFQVRIRSSQYVVVTVVSGSPVPKIHHVYANVDVLFAFSNISF